MSGLAEISVPEKTFCPQTSFRTNGLHLRFLREISTEEQGRMNGESNIQIAQDTKQRGPHHQQQQQQQQQQHL
jgi:hypothetical protein